MKLGSHEVPEFWREVLTDDLAHMRIPGECQATCDACPKVKEENFHPDVRCCSYFPRVPNFLLGLALEDPASASLIEMVIANDLATPEGLLSSPVGLVQSLKQWIVPKPPDQVDVVCDFLDLKNRRCGIYKYRDSVCATFFCKHDNGDKGEEFWLKLQSTMGQAETALSQWSMAELGFDVDAYMERFDSLATEIPRLTTLPSRGWPVDVLQILWGPWFGREAELYRGCAKLVRESKQTLGERLESWVIRSPKKFEQAFYDSLPKAQRHAMRKDGAIPGEPMPISDLLYQLKLAHRNLWMPAE